MIEVVPRRDRVVDSRGPWRGRGVAALRAERASGAFGASCSDVESSRGFVALMPADRLAALHLLAVVVAEQVEQAVDERALPAPRRRRRGQIPRRRAGAACPSRASSLPSIGNESTSVGFIDAEVLALERSRSPPARPARCRGRRSRFPPGRERATGPSSRSSRTAPLVVDLDPIRLVDACGPPGSPVGVYRRRWVPGLVGMALVGLDDALHELVPNDVLVAELDERDPSISPRISLTWMSPEAW